MPVEFVRQNACYDIHEKIVCDSTKLEIAYDGSGRRISKTRVMKTAAAGDWYVDNVTHYTGIGTEVRETHVNGQDETKVVVNMPQGLGRYTPEDAVDGFNGVSASQRAGYRPPAKFEWYLKNHQGESSENALVHFHCRAAEFCALRQNHLGSTMLVYGTSAYSDLPNSGYKDGVKAAYDYRATVVAMRTKQQVAKCCPPFGEQVDLTVPAEKVTENFTGIRLRGECCEHACMFIAEPMGLGAKRKEKDDETELNYFGARYLNPMLGLWVSVDAARQYQNPYLYAGNNPVMRTDPDGNQDGLQDYIRSMVWNNTVIPQFEKAADISAKTVAAGAIAGTAALAVAGGAAIAVAAPEAIAAVASNPAVQRMCVQHCGKIVGAREFLSGAISEPGPSQGKEAVGAVVRGIYDAATENQVPVDEKLLLNDGVAPSDKTGVTIPFDYEEGLNE